MDKATDSTTKPADAEAIEEPVGFGSDDLGRLQNILLGDHARKTGDRIDTLEKALLGVIDDLRGDLQKAITSLEGQIAAEADTRSTAVTNIRDRVTTEVRERKAEDKAVTKELTKDLRNTENDLNQAIEAAETRISQEIAALQATAADLADTDNALDAAKVDRLALATLLSATVAGLEDSSD